jgi:ribosomal-protein-serine acetyltransferase
MTEPSPKPPQTIEAGPAILRRWRRADLDAAYRATSESHDHLRPWMPWAETISREGTAVFLADSEVNWDKGTEFNYAIIVDGEIAGGAGLMARSGPGVLEIGYWVHQDYIRRGLATAAARALTEAAFELPGIEHVEIIHDELNAASEGIPRKLGYTMVRRCQMDNPPSAGTGIGMVWRLDKPERPG